MEKCPGVIPFSFFARQLAPMQSLASQGYLPLFTCDPVTHRDRQETMSKMLRMETSMLNTRGR